MIDLRKQIAELRKSTPKHIQWLLLLAAFIIVLIFLILLLSTKPGNNISDETKPINLIISPKLTDNTIDWTDTNVGDKRTQTLTISADAPVKIMSVRMGSAVDGMKQNPSQTCTSMGNIGPDMSCIIDVEYQPSTAMPATSVDMYIEWRDASYPDDISQPETIIIKVAATGETIAPKPEPVELPKIAKEPDTNKPSIQDDIEDDISSISPGDPFADDEPIAAPVKPAKPAPTPAPMTRVQEACSDFAFPGYNKSGTQIGWIKPDKGAYYFHPFADKECKNPTGVYNPDTGVISDINDKSKKIGTDAEHIGYNEINTFKIPALSGKKSQKEKHRATQLTDVDLKSALEALDDLEPLEEDKAKNADTKYTGRLALSGNKNEEVIVGTSGDAVYSSDPYDRTFVLRQYKPIPATIVSEVRADPAIYDSDMGFSLPVRATVDRNVYSDNGRTVVIPAGTLLLGYVTGNLPGPYKAIGRMDIKWYQFILPNGVEFNFGDSADSHPFSGDSQGRQGVPGYGNTDYVQQFVMPMLTAVVPAAVNLISPISDKFINQIDLDNNTVVQTGTVRSSELAKNDIITAWNQVTQKLLVDIMENTVPPFSIAAGTRITVFSPDDLIITCGDADKTKRCSVTKQKDDTRKGDARNKRGKPQPNIKFNYDDGTWVGQARSFNWASKYCGKFKNGELKLDKDELEEIAKEGLDYSTILFYCQSQQYKTKKSVQQDAKFQSQSQKFQNTYGTAGVEDVSNYVQTGIGSDADEKAQKYNQEVLGLTYDEDGYIQTEPAPANNEATIGCWDGSAPDENGCCSGETFQYMEGFEGQCPDGYCCCPADGTQCFPPIGYE